MTGLAQLLGFHSTTVVKSYTTVVYVKSRDLVAVISEWKCGNSLYYTCSQFAAWGIRSVRIVGIQLSYVNLRVQISAMDNVFTKFN